VLSYVKEIAKQLLAERDGGQTKDKWAYRLVRRNLEIKSQMCRPRDFRKVFCCNSTIISPWFDFVSNIKAEYGVLDDDTCNSDETSFYTGVINPVKLLTPLRGVLRHLTSSLVVVSGSLQSLVSSL
jgi:hypothetical protein